MNFIGLISLLIYSLVLSIRFEVNLNTDELKKGSEHNDQFQMECFEVTGHPVTNRGDLLFGKDGKESKIVCIIQ